MELKIIENVKSNEKSEIIVSAIFELFFNLSYDTENIKQIFNLDIFNYINIFKNNFGILFFGFSIFINLIQDDEILIYFKKNNLNVKFIELLNKFLDCDTNKIQLNFLLDDNDVKCYFNYLKKFENDGIIYEIMLYLFYFLEKFNKFESLEFETDTFLKNEKKYENLEIQKNLFDLFKKNKKI
jgi:hypothetical protein